MPRNIETLHLKKFDTANITLSDELIESFLGLTALQQDIALGHLLNMTLIENYKQSRGTAKTENTMEATACEILANPKVDSFIQLAKNQRLKNTIMTRQEACEILSNDARANIHELVTFDVVETADAKGDLKKQAIWDLTESAKQDPNKLAWITELQSGPQGFKFKIHDHKQAIKQLAEMEGWNKPTKIDHTSSDGSMTPKGFNEFYNDSES